MSKKDAEATRARLEAKFLRSEHWRDLRAGDVVKVRGERGARFVFRCHVVNRSNHASWVEVDELALPRRGALPVAVTGKRPGDNEAGDGRKGENGDEPRQIVRRQRAFDEDRIVPLPRRREKRRPPQGIQGSFDLGD